MDKGKNRRRKEGEAIGKSQWERGNREIARGERNETKSKIQRVGCKRQRAKGNGKRERGKGKEAKGERKRERSKGQKTKGKQDKRCYSIRAKCEHIGTRGKTRV